MEKQELQETEMVPEVELKDATPKNKEKSRQRLHLGEVREIKEQGTSPGNSLGKSWHKIPALGQRSAPLSQGHHGEGLREWKVDQTKQTKEGMAVQVQN